MGLFAVVLLCSDAGAVSYVAQAPRDTLPGALFNWGIDRYFGSLATAESELPAGRFASLDVKEGSTSLASTWVLKSGSLVGLKLRGASADGVLPIFRHSELNTDLGATLLFSRLGLRRRALSYVESSYARYRRELAGLDLQRELRQLEVDASWAAGKARLDTLRQGRAFRALSAKRDEARRAGSVPAEVVDSLDLEVARTRATMRHAEQTLVAGNLASDRNREQLELNNWYRTERAQLYSQIALVGFRMGWQTFAYSVTSRKARLFDPAAVPASQLTLVKSVAQRLSWQYSLYRLSAADPWSYYLAFGTALASTDNRDDLASLDLTDTHTFAGPPIERTSVKKFTAYQGAYRDHIRTLVCTVNGYWFLAAAQLGGPHVSVEHAMRDQTFSRTDATVGWLVSLKAKEGDQTRLNAELFVGFDDLLDMGNSGKSLAHRSALGVRTAFPIPFGKGF